MATNLVEDHRLITFAENYRPRRSLGITHVYRAYAADGALLYIGVAVDFKRRKLAHEAGSIWYPLADHWVITSCWTRAEALAKERSEIARRKPLHNRQGNPDWRGTREPFPWPWNKS